MQLVKVLTNGTCMHEGEVIVEDGDKDIAEEKYEDNRENKENESMKISMEGFNVKCVASTSFNLRLFSQ